MIRFISLVFICLLSTSTNALNTSSLNTNPEIKEDASGQYIEISNLDTHQKSKDEIIRKYEDLREIKEVKCFQSSTRFYFKDSMNKIQIRLFIRKYFPKLIQ